MSPNSSRWGPLISVLPNVFLFQFSIYSYADLSVPNSMLISFVNWVIMSACIFASSISFTCVFKLSTNNRCEIKLAFLLGGPMLYLGSFWSRYDSGLCMDVCTDVCMNVCACVGVYLYVHMHNPNMMK